MYVCMYVYIYIYICMEIWRQLLDALQGVAAAAVQEEHAENGILFHCLFRLMYFLFNNIIIIIIIIIIITITHIHICIYIYIYTQYCSYSLCILRSLLCGKWDPCRTD